MGCKLTFMDHFLESEYRQLSFLVRCDSSIQVVVRLHNFPLVKEGDTLFFLMFIFRLFLSSRVCCIMVDFDILRNVSSPKPLNFCTTQSYMLLLHCY
jgi:hypothetical protein